MDDKNEEKKEQKLSVPAASLFILAICIGSVWWIRSAMETIDTSGIKPIPPITAADVERQVTAVQNSSHIPADDKPRLISLIKLRASSQGAPDYGPRNIQPPSAR